MANEFLTVSEINQFIRDVLRAGIPRAVWVCGEIQEYKEKSGHCYFTLAQKDESTQAVIAKIGVSIWANMRPKFEAILSQAQNPFVLKDDIQVKLLCRVDFYPPFGQVRLIAESIDPIYTLGKIAQDRLKLIAQLKAKGVLDRNKQVSLPLVPLTIGLITSYDSAAYHDFTDELQRSGFAFKVYVIDSVMQGKNTDASIVNGLNVLKKYPLDVVVITRGGGAVAELAAFDSEKIAMAIASYPLPVISGIGHEINTTITDLAAYAFAKTPTATAQYLIGRVNEFYEDLKQKERDLISLVNDFQKRQTDELRHIAVGLNQATLNLLQQHQRRLIALTTNISKRPAVSLKVLATRLVQYQVQFKRIIPLNITRQKHKIASVEKMIDLADPKQVLKRGFTITRGADGGIIRSKKQLKTKQQIVTTFIDGEITSEVVNG